MKPIKDSGDSCKMPPTKWPNIPTERRTNGGTTTMAKCFTFEGVWLWMSKLKESPRKPISRVVAMDMAQPAPSAAAKANPIKSPSTALSTQTAKTWLQSTQSSTTSVSFSFTENLRPIFFFSDFSAASWISFVRSFTDCSASTISSLLVAASTASTFASNCSVRLATCFLAASASKAGSFLRRRLAACISKRRPCTASSSSSRVPILPSRTFWPSSITFSFNLRPISLMSVIATSSSIGSLRSSFSRLRRRADTPSLVSLPVCFDVSSSCSSSSSARYSTPNMKSNPIAKPAPIASVDAKSEGFGTAET
mmetsp:Transcript_71171/g.112497  ORF Transcript_71171/g.112497 Transcript_71171/m.112497 type:complete len:309 (-) Transcript_71171:278-1204(-)